MKSTTHCSSVLKKKKKKIGSQWKQHYYQDPFLLRGKNLLTMYICPISGNFSMLNARFFEWSPLKYDKLRRFCAVDSNKTI